MPRTRTRTTTPDRPATAPPAQTGADAGQADLIDRLRLGSGHAAVVGLQYGDEGKGQLVDVLAGRFDLVVRYNGGANAGHSVHIGEQKFALHLIPSGILYPQTLNVVSNGVVVDPEAILQEIHGLRERGVTVADNLRVSDRAHVVLPYHKVQDALMETLLGASGGDARKIGTTGRGIGPCYADKALRGTAVRMGELLRPDELRQRLAHIVRVKNVMLSALAADAGVPFDPFDPDALTDQYVQFGRLLGPHICDTTRLMAEALDDGRQVLFEGANAALLDVDHGTYPFVTSSNCTSLGIYAGAAVPGGRVGQIIGVVKLYTSRVGGGPFATELFDDTAARIREVGREFGTTTGRPRRCGWLDAVAVRYTARLCGATALCCTGLSVLTGLPSIKVCTGYTLDGSPLDHLPADIHALSRVQPVYEELQGFTEPVGDCRSFAALPAAARRYIRAVEKLVGVPIRIVCVGRRRDQILVR